MQVQQIFTYNQLRNFNYLLDMGHSEMIVIDPWDAQEITSLVKKAGKKLKAIINTHEHFDHIRGNKELIEVWGAEVWAHKNAEQKIEGLTRGLQRNDMINLSDEYSLKVLDTPGHTMAHLCLLLLKNDRPYALFSGDTLFNAGVGNCHNGGDPETLYETIRDYIVPLPEDVLIYPGHDYLDNNLKFTLDREPSNKEAKALLEQREKESSNAKFLLTNMGLEKKINTFFRLGAEELRKGLGLSIDESDKNVFIKLREARNHW